MLHALAECSVPFVPKENYLLTSEGPKSLMLLHPLLTHVIILSTTPFLTPIASP